MTVAEALRDARDAGVSRLDAHLLLARALAQPRSWLIAHDDAELGPGPMAQWQGWLARRAAGEPVAYLLGEKEFHGLLLQVDPAVLVPRPDTEVLVDWALEILRAGTPAKRVVDLGTGSGAIALAVKHGYPAADVVATDVSDAALAVAQRNAERLGLAIALRRGSWWQATGDQRFDLVLANPPYIDAADPHLPELRHEPLIALSPGADGLTALAAIIAGARERLQPGGWLLLEHGHDQADSVRALLAAHGLVATATRHDLGGQPRCSGGRLPRG
jgi:release factor glutamine methyltransferase